MKKNKKYYIEISSPYFIVGSRTLRLKCKVLERGTDTVIGEFPTRKAAKRFIR